MLILVEVTRKNQMKPDQERMGDTPVLPHCTLLRNPWSKPTGVLEHCSEGETNFGSPIFGAFLPDRIHKAKKNVHVHFFIHCFTIYFMQQIL